MSNANIEKRLIFAGIIYLIFIILIIYTHQEAGFGSFSLWIIPPLLNWILLPLIIAFALAFADKIIIAVVAVLLLLFAGFFLFVGIYSVHWITLLSYFIPHTNNLYVKLIVYSAYAVVILLLALPILIRHKVYPYRKYSKWYYYGWLAIGILILFSILYHFSPIILQVIMGLHAGIPHSFFDLTIYVVIGVVALWVVWYILTGEVLIAQQVWEYFFWKAWDAEAEERRRYGREEDARWEQARQENARREERQRYEERQSYRELPREPVKTAIGFAYSFFGLTPSAGDAEVRKAYRAKVMEYHPDRTHRDTNAEMQAINNAYELILKQRNTKS